MLKLKNFFAKIFRFALPALLVVVLCVLFSEHALGLSSWTDSEMVKTFTGFFTTIFSMIIVVIVFISLIFAILMGNLMDSSYILDTGMGDTLHLIWEVMRNFVNVGFIIILLIIAAVVVLGIGQEGGVGMLKKVLPKFILALIFVNLTFFGARVVLTTNDVLTTAIFSLPRVVSGDNMLRLPCPSNESMDVCQERIEGILSGKKIYNKDGKLEDKTGSTGVSEGINTQLKELTQNGRWFPHKIKDIVGKKNMPLVLLMSMTDLEHLVYTKGILGRPGDAAIGAIGSIIVAGAVGIIFFMLFLAFVVRMVVLWITIAVSPLVALTMVLKEVAPNLKIGNFDPMDIFIKHAFMPAMVAIPLSIGMIMIFANNTIGYDVDFGRLFSFSDGLYSGSLNSILWWIASIIVIWFGTNAMIKEASPQFAATLTDKIHGGVNSFVGGAASLIKYAPIVPAWAGGSMSGLASAPSLAASKLQEHNLPNKQALAGNLAYAFSGGKISADTKGSSVILQQNISSISKSLNQDQRQQEALRYIQTHAESKGEKTAKLGAVMSKDLRDMFKHVNPAQVSADSTIEDFLKAVQKNDEKSSNKNAAGHAINTYNQNKESGDQSTTDIGRIVDLKEKRKDGGSRYEQKSNDGYAKGVSVYLDRNTNQEIIMQGETQASSSEDIDRVKQSAAIADRKDIPQLEKDIKRVVALLDGNKKEAFLKDVYQKTASDAKEALEKYFDSNDEERELLRIMKGGGITPPAAG